LDDVKKLDDWPTHGRPDRLGNGRYGWPRQLVVGAPQAQEAPAWDWNRWVARI